MTYRIRLVDPETLKDAKDGALAIFINGEFEASWNYHELPTEHIRQIFENMLNKAYEQGKSKRSKEIRKLLDI